jgi:hypothetical protein
VAVHADLGRVDIMKRTLALGLSAFGLILLGGGSAGATPANWGQEVKQCNETSCYPGGTSRGAYVSGQARDGEGPGYAWEIHTLANPGSASPAGHGE